MKNCISVRNLSFSYDRNARPILSIDQFSLRAGAHLFLYGASGSGKSTFLNLINGLLTPTAGELEVCAEKLHLMSARARDRLRGQKLGVIFQQFNLVNYLTARENIMLPALFHQLPEAPARASALIEKLDLTRVANQKAASLSLGEQQRVAAARALLGRPSLIIADEPTSSLDTKNTERFMAGLFEAAAENNTAILFVSHDQSLKSHFKESVDLQELQKGVGPHV